MSRMWFTKTIWEAMQHPTGILYGGGVGYVDGSGELLEGHVRDRGGLKNNIHHRCPRIAGSLNRKRSLNNIEDIGQVEKWLEGGLW